MENSVPLTLTLSRKGRGKKGIRPLPPGERKKGIRPLKQRVEGKKSPSFVKEDEGGL